MHTRQSTHHAWTDPCWVAQGPLHRGGGAGEYPTSKHRTRAGIFFRLETDHDELFTLRDSSRQHVAALDERNRPISLHGLRGDVHPGRENPETAVALLAPVGPLQHLRPATPAHTELERSAATCQPAIAAPVQHRFRLPPLQLVLVLGLGI